MSTKLPRRGTKIRAALERWLLDHDGKITFGEFSGILDCDRYGMWPTKNLKRYGRKAGIPGDKSVWVMRPEVSAMLSRVLSP